MSPCDAATQVELALSDAQCLLFNSFPAELISQIFLHCIPETQTAPNRRDAPLVLCWVNGRWRQIARSTPELWSKLCITLPKSGLTPQPPILSRRSGPFPQPGRGTADPKPQHTVSSTSPAEATCTRDDVALSDLWLTQSRISLLSLSLAVHREEDFDIARTILNNWMSQIHRWKFFSYASDTPPWSTAAPLIVDSLANSAVAHHLDDVSFDASSWYRAGEIGIPSIRWATSILLASPCLRNLAWRGALEPLLNFPLPHLTSLDIEYHDTRVNKSLGNPIHLLMKILNHMPALQCCRLQLVIEKRSRTLFEGVHTTLQYLQSFTIVFGGMGYAYIAPLFDFLILPALTSLSVKYLVSRDVTTLWPGQTEFISFLSRSACCLSTLAINGLVLEESQLIALLTHPAVNNTLRILDMQSEDKFDSSGLFRILNRTQTGADILPQLESLAVSVGFTEVLYFKNMVLSRQPSPAVTNTSQNGSVATLKQVTVFASALLSQLDTLKSVMGTLRQQGVQVRGLE